MRWFASSVCVVALWGCSKGSAVNAPENGKPPCLDVRSAETDAGAEGTEQCPKVDSEPAPSEGGVPLPEESDSPEPDPPPE
ncbi:MAG TPA: hypothetical protein VI072_29940 [Polyangiaceae bacterium]